MKATLKEKLKNLCGLYAKRDFEKSLLAFQWLYPQAGFEDEVIGWAREIAAEYDSAEPAPHAEFQILKKVFLLNLLFRLREESKFGNLFDWEFNCGIVEVAEELMKMYKEWENESEGREQDKSDGARVESA